MELRKKKIEEFVKELAGPEPVPGGGGASAMVAAIGIALGNMVGSLTTGKEKYAAVEADIRRLMKDADYIADKLMAMADEDAAAFKPLSEAYGMPADTKEQKAEKEKEMEKCLVRAAKPPLEIMKLCGWALDVIDEFAEKGSKLVLSDAGVAAALCRAALESAYLNVLVNTALMKNRNAAKIMDVEASGLLDRYIPQAKKTYKKVKTKIKK